MIPNQGNDAVFKLRCSEGIRVKSFIPDNGKRMSSPLLFSGKVIHTHGNSTSSSSTSPEVELSNVTPDTCIVVDIEHRGNSILNRIKSSNNKGAVVHFQSALLYTDTFGSRRLRISTLSLPVTGSVKEAYEGIDMGVMATVLTREAMNDAFPCSPNNQQFSSNNGSNNDLALRMASDNIADRCASILSGYRLNTDARKSSQSGLVLPESLSLLPVFCHSIRNSPILRPNKLLSSYKVCSNGNSWRTADRRAYRAFYSARVIPALAMLYVCEFF